MRLTCLRSSRCLVSTGCRMSVNTPSSKSAAWSTRDLAVPQSCSRLRQASKRVMTAINNGPLGLTEMVLYSLCRRVHA